MSRNIKSNPVLAGLAYKNLIATGWKLFEWFPVAEMKIMAKRDESGGLVYKTILRNGSTKNGIHRPAS